MKFTLTFCLVLLLSFDTASAQRRANVWPMTDSLGITFNTSPPSTLTLSSSGGTSSSACQKDSGALVFYNDNRYIFNKLGNKVDSFPNSGGVWSTIVVPIPTNDTLFYIFYSDYSPTWIGGIRYSLFNANLNSGLGGIEPGYNGVLQDTGFQNWENLAAVHHANGCDVWIIAHSDTGNQFRAYLITPIGIQTPVISNAGEIYSGFSPDLGVIKFSPDGSKLAITMNINGYNGGPATVSNYGLQIFNFDNQTGLVSPNPLSIMTGPILSNFRELVHGASFSCDNSKLYYSKNTGELFQVDLMAGSDSAIISSRTVINPGNITLQNLAMLQLAPDHKIYLAQYFNDAFSVINNPEIAGVSCNFQDSVLARRYSQNWLPQYIESYFFCPPLLNLVVDTIGCIGDTLSFSVDSILNASNYEWSFGDSTTANGISVTHSYSAGSYELNLIVHYNCNALIANSNKVEILMPPNSNLLNDVLICGNDSLQLTASIDSTLIFYWSTGDTIPSISVDTPGTYSVTISNGVCSISDSIRVRQIPYPNSLLPVDTLLCGTDSLFITAGPPGLSYQWSTGDTIPTIPITTPNIYLVNISDSICYTNDSIIVSQIDYPIGVLPSDTSICGGDSIILIASSFGLNYQWSTGDSTNSISVSLPGSYIVTISDSICAVLDSVNVHQINYPIIALPNDTLLCRNAPITLTAGPLGYSYLWSTGDTLNSVVINNSGSYFVSALNGSCYSYDTIQINQIPFPIIAMPPDTFICGSGPVLIGIEAASNNYSYIWSSGDTTQEILVNIPGVYNVIVSDSLCSVNESISVYYKSPALLDKIPNVFTPNGDDKNELFILGNGFDTHNLQIWNRWGKKVFESNEGIWDGKNNGELQSEGTYYYIAEVVDCSSIPTAIRGTVYLKH